MTDFKEGDKVRVVFDGVVEGGFVVSGDYKLMAVQCPLIDRAISIELIERAGRPLEVGELVFYHGDKFNVVAIYCGEAWLKAGSLNNKIASFSELVRPCGTPITEAKS